MEVEAFSKLDPENFFRKFISEKVRPDGRSFNRVRNTSVVPGILSKNAYGSALAKIGNTKVIAGIMLQIGNPTEAHPTWGEISVEVNLSPLSCTLFNSQHKSNEIASALAEYIRTIINGSEVIKQEDLCIQEGKSVWKLCLDISCLNYDGNLYDTSLLAAIVALKDLTLPVPILRKDHSDIVISEERVKKLDMNHLPFSLTFGIFDDVIISDLSFEEEQLVSTKISIAKNSAGELCTVYKPGGVSLSGLQLKSCMELATQRVAELNKIVNSGFPSS